jgi:nucleotide-binding universal stress UspA family protein
MPSTIVVGYDGHDHASDALALGRLLARADGVRLVVACAYPEDPLGESAAAHEIAQGVRADAEAVLDRARAELAAAPGAPVEAELRAIAGAAPARVLHELAESVDAELIVVGATHHGAAVRLLTGSTPERVLDGAHCAVAVAPEGFAAKHAEDPRAIGRIAVAYAFEESPEADLVLEHAVALARRTGAALRVVTAVNSTVGLYPPLDPTAYREISDVAREAAQIRLDRVAARLEGDVTVTTEVLDGDAALALVADSEDDDLMFTGSRGHGPFRRVLLGSVSTKLLREAACPVVIVPRGSGEGENAAADADPAADSAAS